MSMISRVTLISTLLSASLLAATLHAATMPEPSTHQAVISVEQEQRLAGWRNFILAHRHARVPDLLRLVNRYLNQYPYVKDTSGQGATERWATPYEFILNNGGDCEDFAIAKYFMLSALGIPEDELQITYVYHRNLQQYHMVLVYSPAAQRQALVLDNLTDTILAFGGRMDLAPVYGFNRHNLWVINEAAARSHAGSASRLSRWRQLMKRLTGAPIPL